MRVARVAGASYYNGMNLYSQKAVDIRGYNAIKRQNLARLWHILANSNILWHTLEYSSILWHTLANFGLLWHDLV